jgi:heme/copper-type cytochrome/quinol oxidase subunit 2
MSRLRQTRVLAVACVAVAGGMVAGLSGRAQGQIREFGITGRDHSFAPARIEVQRDDLVKVTFTAADIPHSFTIDEYRIAKRAAAGQSVTFEFRADQPGTFRFYCSLTQDDRCRNMHGTLTVR